MNYDLCPRYYYLRHILGLPERGRAQSAAPTQGSLSATQRGTIVHRVVEQIKDPKELSRLVQDAAAVEGLH